MYAKRFTHLIPYITLPNHFWGGIKVRNSLSLIFQLTFSIIIKKLNEVYIGLAEDNN
jgi:hypothetical protein